DLELAILVELAELDLAGAGDLHSDRVGEAPLAAGEDPRRGPARLVAVAVAGRRGAAGRNQIEPTVAVEIAERRVEGIAADREPPARAEFAVALARHHADAVPQ